MLRRPLSTRRKLQLQAFAILCVCSLFLFGCFLLFGEDTQQRTSTQTETPISTATTTVTQHPDYPTLYDVVETSEQPQIPYTLHYVKTKHTAINARIDDYIASLKASISNEQPIELQTAIETFNETTISLRFTYQRYREQQVIDEQTMTIVYEEPSGEIITIDALFQNNEKALNTLQMLMQQYAPIGTTPEGFPRHWKDIANFTLTPYALNLYMATEQGQTNHAVALPILTVNEWLAKPYQQGIAPPFHTIDDNYVRDTSKMRVALTFDDGPHPTVTPQILDILQKYDVQATFFLVGQRVQQHPEIVQRIVEEGHEIGNHTWSHPNITTLPINGVQQEFIKTNEAIIAATNYAPTVFRPPYGATSDTLEKLLPIPSVLWSIDTLDWRHRDPQQTIAIVNKHLHNNAIILMHDIHQPTADALETIILNLQHANYDCVTASEILLYK